MAYIIQPMGMSSDAALARARFFERKRKADAERSKSRINLGVVAFPRWRALKERLLMRSDAELGLYLLDMESDDRLPSQVNIGSAFQRWSELKEIKRLAKHSEVATFLLDWYDQTSPSTSQTSLPSGSLSPDRTGRLDSHIQGKPQQAVTSGDTHSCTNGPESSDAAITVEIHGFSDEENVSPDEEKDFPDEENMSPDEEKDFPDEENMSPDEEKYFPDEEKMSPDKEKYFPDEEKMPPDEEKYFPDEEKVPPDEEKYFPDEEKMPPDEEKMSPDEEKDFPDEEKYSYDEGGGEETCCNKLRYDLTGPSTSKPCLTSGSLSPDRVQKARCSDEETLSASESQEERYDPTGPSTSKPCLTSGALSPDREHHQTRCSDEETLSASESLEERFSRMDSISTVDPHIQGNPQQAVTSGDINDPGSSGAAITEIIGFSDEENVSSDEEHVLSDEENDFPDEGIDSSDEGEGPSDHSSDSDWTPDKTVGSMNEEEENYSSVEGEEKRLAAECERGSDLDGDPLEHHNMNSSDLSGREEVITPQQAVPLRDTRSSAATITENIGISVNFDKDGAVGRKLRRLCPECGMLFKAWKPHTCEHKIKPCSCNLCGKRFAKEFPLKLHKEKVHKESYTSKCKFCLAPFKTRADKLKHELSHPPAVKPYQCSDCPETFLTFTERREHLKSHRGPVTPVIAVCQICNARLANIAKLQRHMIIHTGEKRYLCEVCQRSFNQPGHLKSHMRVHTGEKPYQCQHCDKSFNHNVSLKSHIQRYHGHVPDPGMKVQTKKTKKNESTAELDDTAEMQNSGLDEEEAERNNDTGNSEEVTKKLNNTFTGKDNSLSSAVITSDDQLKRKLRDGDENEEGRGNGYSASDSADEEEEKRGNKKLRKATWRSKGRPTNSGGEEHSSDSDFDLESEEHSTDSDFDPTRRKPKKRGGAQTCKDRGRRRGRSKNNPLV